VSPKPNMLSAIYSPQGAIDLVAGRWAALVLHALAQRTKRGSELRREIGGAVAKDADRAPAG
jgi:DNA-binding HxlR family transcriptional regulator